MMTLSTLAVASLLVLGAITVFRSSGRQGRVAGLGLVALAGVAAIAIGAPDRVTAVVVSAVSAVTLLGLLAVAVLLESNIGADHLDLQQDPLRWG